MNLTRSESESAAWDEVAPCYEEAIISPFAPGVRFRFRKDVHRIIRKWQIDGTLEHRVVTDFGCGCGLALSLIARRVGFAVGIDFSEKMLDQSQSRLEKAGINVSRYSRRNGLRALAHRIDRFERAALPEHQTVLVNSDMRRLGPLHKRIDLGLAINSICPPNSRDVKVIFREVTACIKSGGLCIFLFPSMDTMYYLLGLIRRYGAKRAKASELGHLEREDGFYVGKNGDRQKYFMPNEIQNLFESQGWVIDEMEKLRYPWDLVGRMGWGYFPKHQRLWDWYVIGHSLNR